MAYCIGFVVRVWCVALVASVLLAGPLLALPIEFALPAVITQLGVLIWMSVRVPILRASAATDDLGSLLPWIALGSLSMMVIAPNLAVLNRRVFPYGTDDPDPFERLMDRPSGYAAFLVLSVAVAPLLEELVFRGWLQRELSFRLGVLASLLISSALFSLLHLTPWRLPYYFVLGLLFGGVFVLTGSIWAGFAFHAAFNGALLFISVLFPTRAGFAEWILQPMGGAINAVLLSLALFFLVMVARKLRVLGAPRRAGAGPPASTVSPAPAIVARGRRQ